MRSLKRRATRRGRRLIALTLSLPVLFPAAAAARPFEASGSIVATAIEQSNFRSAGGVTFFDYMERQDVTGTLSGAGVLRTSCAIRDSGQGVCTGVETFTGTVAGRSGTLRWHDVVFVDATTGAFHGTFTTLDGTGALATLHGHGTFQGGSGTGTYTGRLVFAPR
jgi:hypothetical protein